MVMNAAAVGIHRPQTTEIRGILPEKEEDTQGMANLLEEVAPKGCLFMTMTYMLYTKMRENITT